MFSIHQAAGITKTQKTTQTHEVTDLSTSTLWAKADSLQQTIVTLKSTGNTTALLAANEARTEIMHELARRPDNWN